MTKKPLSESTRQATQAFVARVAAAYPVMGAILFGACAHGSATTDADVALILKGHGDIPTTQRAMADMARAVLLDTGIGIRPLLIWEDEWEDPERYSNPRLLDTLAREGVPL